MAGFDYRVSINPLNRKGAEKLMREHGINATLYASWSYDGTMVECEDFEDFDKLDSDEDYAQDRIVQTKTTY